MIQVIINMDPQSGNLSIGSEAPPLLVWSVVCAAYYEMLSKKIQADIKEAARVEPATVIQLEAIKAAKRIIR